MSVCKNIKSFTQRHESIADLFSLMAVALLFGTIWAAITYRADLFFWVKENVFLNAPLLALAIIADIFLIFIFLSIGASRTEDDAESCFTTFRGRRHGGMAAGNIFSSWLHHMEDLGKKHR